MSPNNQAILDQFNALAEKHPKQGMAIRMKYHLQKPKADAPDWVVKHFLLMMIVELRQAVK